jgi:hypothetical protein
LQSPDKPENKATARALLELTIWRSSFILPNATISDGEELAIGSAVLHIVNNYCKLPLAFDICGL